MAAAVVFVVSLAFPSGACAVGDTSRLPRIWGILDVAVAALLGILVIAVAGLAEKHVDERARSAAYRAYRVLMHAILAGIVLFFLAGEHVNWPVCLIGFAWRTWLLLYALPAWLVAVRPTVRKP